MGVTQPRAFRGVEPGGETEAQGTPWKGISGENLERNRDTGQSEVFRAGDQMEE